MEGRYRAVTEPLQSRSRAASGTIESRQKRRVFCLHLEQRHTLQRVPEVDNGIDDESRIEPAEHADLVVERNQPVALLLVHLRGQGQGQGQGQGA